MRNAALILGLIGGLVGMIVGFFGYGFAALGEIWAEFSNATQQLGVTEVIEDPAMTKILGLVSPILGIAGAAMAPSLPVLAAVLLGASTAGMYEGFGFNMFTMFPVSMTGLAAAFAALGAVLPPRQASH